VMAWNLFTFAPGVGRAAGAGVGPCHLENGGHNGRSQAEGRRFSDISDTQRGDCDLSSTTGPPHVFVRTELIQIRNPVANHHSNVTSGSLILTVTVSPWEASTAITWNRFTG